MPATAMMSRVKSSVKTVYVHLSPTSIDKWNLHTQLAELNSTDD